MALPELLRRLLSPAYSAFPDLSTAQVIRRCSMEAQLHGEVSHSFFRREPSQRLFIPIITRHSGAAKRNPEPRAEDFRLWIPGSRCARPGKTAGKILKSGPCFAKTHMQPSAPWRGKHIKFEKWRPCPPTRPLPTSPWYHETLLRHGVPMYRRWSVC